MEGRYEPHFIEKGRSRITGFDDKILACYARGMSTRDIADTFEEMFDAKVSHSIISQVTESVQEEVELWKNRPLDEVYPIVYLDCIHVKICHNKQIVNKAIYLALGVNLDGHKELLGMWISEHEGAKFWLSVLTELNNRGVQDILIACVDGLTGFPEAIEAVFPSHTHSALYCSSHTQLATFCLLERQETTRSSTQAHLYCSYRRRGT